MTTHSFPDDIDRLLIEFRAHRERLRWLVGTRQVSTAAAGHEDLIREVDEIGERLLVADEELRVQTEALADTQGNLARVLSAYENLFMEAPVPYVHTDNQGIIQRNNRAAAGLIAGSGTPSRAIVSLFRASDRGAVRDLLSRVRAEDPRSPAVRSRPVPSIEVALQQGDDLMPVVVSAQLILPGGAAPLVHWELRPRPASPLAPSPAADASAVVSMTAALREIAGRPDLGDMAETIATAGQSLVPSATGAALTLRRARDRVDVAAATDANARMFTEAQPALRQGPALDTLRSGVVARTDSLADDPRWPLLAADKPDLGIASVLAAPLIGPRGTFGALVCYSDQQAAFDPGAQALATSFASLAALLYSARELEVNLRAGMETRERIGQAVGVLMERHRLTSQRAFDLMVYVSQRTHRKLREIANWVTETGEDPHEFLRGAVEK